MVLLVVGLEASQDLHRILDRGLVDVDLLEAADQRAVLLEVAAIFLVGGRADAAQRAALQRRLQQVGGVHRAARGGAGADHGMDLVDEEDGAVERLELAQHRLEALLEIAAIARAGEQRAHVERIDRRVGQHLGHLAADDAPRQPFGDRRLADAGIADIERVVLRAPAEDLDGALDLRLAANQRIDLAVARLLVEVDAVGVERFGAALRRLLGSGLGVGTLDAPRLRAAARLGDAVADVVDRVEPRHLLLLQEVDGVALALGEDRDQHVGAGDLLAAGGLDVDRRPLQHALEARGRLRLAGAAADQAGELAVDIFGEVAAQPLDIDVAGAHHGNGVLVVGQRQQQMLEGRIFVPPLLGVGERAMQRLFEIGRQHRPATPFPACIAAGAGSHARSR